MVEGQVDPDTAESCILQLKTVCCSWCHDEHTTTSDL